jgi:hypothetical protein
MQGQYWQHNETKEATVSWVCSKQGRQEKHNGAEFLRERLLRYAHLKDQRRNDNIKMDISSADRTCLEPDRNHVQRRASVLAVLNF